MEQTVNDNFMRKVNKAVDVNRLFIFDLDLYNATRHSWLTIKDFLREGDLLYFDEAFDRDERIVIENYLIGYENLKIVSASIFGLVFQVQRIMI